MQIDWITVSAQIVNFLVLVWLLKRFLYQPVIQAMDRREESIAKRLDDAVTRETSAEDARQSFEEKERGLERERERLLEEAGAEAAAEHKRLVDAARSEVAELREQWKKQIEEERVQFLTDLRRRAAESVAAVARRTLADLAGADLEGQVVAVFVERLRELDDDTLEAFRNESGSLLVVSSFEIAATHRRRLEEAVAEMFGRDADIKYERSREPIFGIELSQGGRKLSWTAADHMNILDDRLDEIFQAAGPAASRQ